MKENSNEVVMKKVSIVFLVSFLIIIVVIVFYYTGLFKSIVTDSFTYEENGVKYRLYRSSQEAEVIKSPNANGKLTIPSFIIKKDKKYNVTTIKEEAFSSNNNIQELYISEGIKIVEKNSFPSRLSKVSVPNSIEVFEVYYLGYSYISTTLEKNVFNGCEYLGNDENPYVVLVGANSSLPNTLDLPDGLKVICEGLSDRYIENVILPDSVTSIEYRAFANCTLLENIIISEESNLKHIKQGAFNGCIKLKELYIPKNCVDVEGAIIGDFANENYKNNLESINVHPDNKLYDSRENCNAIIETKTNKLLVGCGNTIIPNNIVVLGENSFAGVNFYFYELEFPESLIKIEDNAFANSNIKLVTLNEKLEYLGNHVFYGCSYLEKLIINKNIKEIGTSICEDCSNIKKLVIPFIGKSMNEKNEREFNLSYLFLDTKNFGVSSVNKPNLTIYIMPKEKYTIKKGSISGTFKEIYFLDNVSTIESEALNIKVDNIYLSKSINIVEKNISVYSKYTGVYSKITGKIYLEASNLGNNWNNSWNNMNGNLEFGYSFDYIYSEFENE